MHAFRDRGRLIERYGIVDVLREALLHLGQELSDPLHSLHSVGPGQLIHGDGGCGLAIQTTDQAVVLCAQFYPGHVFHPDDATIRRFADDDVAKLFR